MISLSVFVILKISCFFFVILIIPDRAFDDVDDSVLDVL